MLARICLADLAEVELVDDPRAASGRAVRVTSSQPVMACLASQYAGWELKDEKYFAMGSGPMRAAAAREPLFTELAYHEQPAACVGVLESGKLPPDSLCRTVAAKCGVAPGNLTLLVAPTRTAAGTLQVVARSLETALHKLHELKFDLSRVAAGVGSAPLPPLAGDDLAAIGRTNDAVLYGGDVRLDVRGDDASLREFGPQLPSSASRDFGRPFAELMRAYDNDFYRIDPLLFSPARVTLRNLDTGTELTCGELHPELLAESFAARTAG